MKKLLMLLLTAWALLGVTLASSRASDNAQTDLDCLAEAIYFEGRSEPFIGQLAIANVVLIRTTKSICDTVHDRCQFSYWCDGKHEIMRDATAKATSYTVARLALDGAIVGETEGATHYHATYVNPYWAGKLFYVDQIGKHLFYIED